MLPFSDYKKIKTRNFNLVGKIRLKVLVVLGTLVAVLFASQLVFANSLAEDGQKLAKIDAEIRKLEDSNISLKAEIASESSLSTLSTKALELGFKKPQKVISP